MAAAVRSGVRKHHQVDVATDRLAPFAEFGRQGVLLGAHRLGFQVLEALVHQVKGVVDQLGSLFGGHVTAGEGTEDGWLGVF